ncbi:MAG: hypothetical protein AAGK17_04090 [Pseudomonadota bacterium]
MRFATKFAAIPVLALASTLPLAAPAVAETETSKDTRILVTEMDSWQANATRRLNRALQRNPINQTGAPAPGIVQLSFTLNAKGSPTNVEVLSNSANRPAAQSAKYAVRRMGDLSDVPVSNVGDTQFIANVIFANDHREKRRLIAELKSKPYASFASKSGSSTYVVLSN